MLSAQPTVEKPVEISVAPSAEQLPPGSESALVITFRIPKYMWLGAPPEQARTPAGTKIELRAAPHFQFETPQFPRASVEGVPAHVGTTKVYQGEIKVIVPFEVSESAEPGDYEITALLTYTPGFSAGKLSTHVQEPYTARVRVDPQAERPGPIPEPSKASVPEDFRVSPKQIKDVKPFFFPYQQKSGFAKLMHTIFLDPAGHDKRLRQVTYPFINASEVFGTSLGLGIGLLNTTPEGVLTGVLSLVAYHNSFIGPAFGLDLVTCPAAYHNLRFNVRLSGEAFNQAQAIYENFTLGEDDRWGLQAKGLALQDPRFRFFGLGPNAPKQNGSVYQHEELSAVIDGYALPLEKLRIGLGYKIKSVDVQEGDPTVINDEGIPSTLTADRFSDLPGLEGATVTGGRLNIIFDGRNQEFNPTRGFFGKLTAEYNTFLDDGGQDLEDTYGSLQLDLRQYFSSTDQKFIALFRNQWMLNTSRNIPFFEQARLGGRESIRAFGAGRFTGQHLLFLSAEVRYSLFKFTVLKFPMVLQLGAFLDAGQVFNDNGFEGAFHTAPGVSVRAVNYPNAGYIINIARSREGVLVTGGIALPF